MKTRPGAGLGASRAGSRWNRQMAVRVEREGQRSSILLLLAVAAFVLSTVAGFAWAQDRQLRAGLLEQRTEARGREDWVPLASLPPHVPLAFLVAVDPTFLHRSPLAAGAEGATLSRAMARQVYRLGHGLRAEARALVMGPLLEARLPDAELLELYLNRVRLGEDDGWPAYGVHHAAREYFGKQPQDLTVGEAATLAGLLLPPRITEPRRQVGAVGIRRNEVLRQMLDVGAITEAEYAAAVQEPLGLQPGPEHLPMARPHGWQRDTEVIRLPPELEPPPEP